MLSKIEMKYYKDITRIANALERIAKAAENTQKQDSNAEELAEIGRDSKMIGARVAQRMHEKGMSQSAAANARDVMKLAKVLGCSAKWLLGGDEDE